MNARDSDQQPVIAPAASAPSRLARQPATASTGDVRVVTSAALFAGHAELRIEHHGAVYRLKQTALGKLILTK